MIDILKIVKRELLEVNHHLDYDHLEEDVKELDNYFKILLESRELDLEEVFEEEEEQVGLQEIYDPLNNLFIGRAKLLLGGGKVGSFEIFIPESFIRQIGIEEGDWIKVSAQSRYFSQGIEKFIYDYEILEKDPIPETNRKVLRKREVYWDHYLREYYIEGEDEQGLSLKILLNEKKLHNIEIEEGDFVDYAYYDDEILEGKVIWCFNQ